MDTMGLALRYIFEFVLYTECIGGIIINLFIVAAYIIKWQTMKYLHVSDKILSSLVLCRIFILFSLLAYLSPIYDLLVSEHLHVMCTVEVVTMFLHYLNLCFTTVLCVFYCVKITNYNWKFFIFLKTKISTLVPQFLLASVPISLCSSLPFGWYIFEMQIKNLTNVSKENMTQSQSVVRKTSPDTLLLFFVGSLPHFLIFLVAALLLFHSLWMHTRRMRSSGSGFRSPSLEAHFRAVKIMILFLLLHIIYFISMTLYFSVPFDTWKTAFWINLIATYSPPCLHSMYIISSNRDLKNIFISLFHVLICYNGV
ncbi:taste receptor type 2 member 40-like [Anomaloglossus baeobatrachus]|uniref:taste receptor type 2 member 40-like n=1 Tax=Anomaloglossus baeobatrachus TaxID=238106 RepID=UPI003F4F4C1E